MPSFGQLIFQDRCVSLEGHSVTDSTTLRTPAVKLV